MTASCRDDVNTGRSVDTIVVELVGGQQRGYLEQVLVVVRPAKAPSVVFAEDCFTVPIGATSLII